MATAPLVEIHPTGIMRSYILWLHPVTNRWLKEEITQAQYEALASTPVPPKPKGFTGTDGQWSVVWSSNRAKAISGRPLFDTPDGGTFAGAMRSSANGLIFIYFGDQDNDKILRLDFGDYTGVPPSITVTKPIPVAGVTVSGGILTVT